MNDALPGHIKKAYRSVDRFLPVVDLVVELVDARMPEGSRLKGYVARAKKDSIIVLGKADLADDLETKKWIEYYKKSHLTAIALDARNNSSVTELANTIKLFASTAQNIKRKVRRIMVVGIPNVGKSTLINSLAKRKAAQTANKPGVTRDIQWIKLPGKLELLDLPGILDFSLLRKGNILRLINCLPEKNIDVWQQAYNIIQFLQVTNNLHILPDVSNSDINISEYISDYALKMNFLIKGGLADDHRAASDIIKRFQSGNLGKVTLEKCGDDLDSFIRPTELETGDQN